MNVFCISRTDSIGDVVLTLPLAGFLKRRYPDSKVIFLGRRYTEKVVRLSEDIDEIVIWDDLKSRSQSDQVKELNSKNITHLIHVFPNKDIAKLGKQAKIPFRIGTSHRFYHYLTCNKTVNFTRKKSDLHEAQLNFELLKPILKDRLIPSLNEISEYLNIHNDKRVNFSCSEFGINEDKPILILHPKSQGSAVEWGVENFINLIDILKDESVNIVVTGTESESQFFRERLPIQENLFDLSGKLTLDQLISLIENSHALVAASTGPLHLAGLFNLHAIGLFSSRRPIHPGRWKPLGLNSVTIVYDENCTNCKKGKECSCIHKIQAEQIKNLLKNKKLIS